MSEIKKLTNNENVIFYNNDLEQLLAQSAEECESLGILHLASYEKYNKLSNIINIPVIVLSSGIGFITGIDLNYDRMNIILGIGSVFVGIIKSIDSYFQLGKRAESHRMCALQYTQINKKIQIELSLCREQRQTAKDMLSIIKTDIKNLQDISPVIDQEIIKDYNLKYGKYKNVKKPNFVNGLSSVKVNSNSLEQEMASARSIPQSVQSGAPSRATSVMGDNSNYYGGGGGGSGGGGDGSYNNFSDDFRGGNNESNFPDLNTNIVNLNDVAVNIPLPLSNFQSHTNATISSNVSNNSQPNSRIRSPARLSNANQSAPPSASAIASASAQLVFANGNSTAVQTPVSSSPIPALRLHEHYNNNNVAVAASSRLSTPQLLTSFQEQSDQSQQPDQSEVTHAAENADEISFVIDIPDDNNNNPGASLNSSPGSQVGSM